LTEQSSGDLLLKKLYSKNLDKHIHTLGGFFSFQVSANTEDSTMSGYLHRSKGSKKPWKHLWFVIKNKVLYTYAASEVRDDI